MHRNLFLGLVIVVLFGALAVGNPFLPCRSDRAMPRDAAPVPVSSVEAGFGAVAGHRASSGLAGLRAGLPLATPVSLRAGGAAADASRMQESEAAGAGELTLLPCPEPALQSEVVAVKRGFDGEPVWLLRDGRRLRRAGDAVDGLLHAGPAPSPAPSPVTSPAANSSR